MGFFCIDTFAVYEERILLEKRKMKVSDEGKILYRYPNEEICDTMAVPETKLERQKGHWSNFKRKIKIIWGEL